MLFMKRLLLPLVLAVGWFGCSGDQPGPGAEEDKFKSEGAFCAEWAKVACNDEVVSACNGTKSGCIESQQSACGVVVPLGYESTYAEDCLNAVEDAYEDAELDAEELDVVLRLGGDCATLVDGGEDEGDGCAESFDCNGVNGYVCVIKPGETAGTCQAPNEVPTGDLCRADDAVCGPDDYCDPGTTRCITRLASEPCPFDDACPADYRCDIAAGATEGTCEPRLSNGDDCIANEECASGICLGATNKVCASNVVLTVESSLCDTLR
jgi:hypothetical protein